MSRRAPAETPAVAGHPRARGSDSGAALPDDWDGLWGRSDVEPARIQWHQLKKLSAALASEIELLDARDSFGALVGSEGLRAEPVHRWFSYKEGYSPRLLAEVLTALDLDGDGLHVFDGFGGVATTALAGLGAANVAEVRSVEYSPFARFVGQTKLAWPTLEPQRLAELLPNALAYDRHRPTTIPSLAAFSNPAIFSPARIRTILAARDHVRELAGARPEERDFFLLGVAAVVEDLSGAMKDGRALRIRRGRSRRPSSLADADALVPATGVVKRALGGQWSAMLRDLSALAGMRRAAEATLAFHVAGDARHLESAALPSGRPLAPDGWAQLALFSPPYLNCIDYTELYKLELWLMEHVVDQASFRQTRLGTLRSHPSVRFDERDYLKDADGSVVELIDGLAMWMEARGPRPEVAPVVRQYFEDMLQVWREQLRVLASGGASVCVVANSTFSRRERGADGSRRELWRLPILTDVILAHLALVAGFRSVQIWHARDLRPRNVQSGRARESLVVAQKA